MALTSDIATVTGQINTYIKENGNEEITATLMNTILQAIKGLISQAVTDTFDNGDLDANYEYAIEHNLDTLVPEVLVYDGSGKLYGPANIGITVVDEDNITLSLADAIGGTWTYLIVKHD